MKVIDTIKKLYEIIKVKYLKLPKIIRNIFEFILFSLNAYGFVVLPHISKILYLLLISFWIIIGLIIYFFISKRFNKLFLIPIILLFILFILEFTPYNSQSMGKTFMEMTHSNIKNFSIYSLYVLLTFILLSIFCAISFFVNKPFFLYNSINKIKKNIIIGILFFIPALFLIFIISILIRMNLNNTRNDYFIFADTVSPYNKVILSNLQSIFVLKNNKLERLTNRDFISFVLPLRWYGGLSLDANYITYSEEYSLSGIENIWLMRTDGRDKKQLTYNEKISILTCSKYPLFNSKGNKIAFLRYKLIWKDKLSKESLGLYVINTDGTGEKQIVSPMVLRGDWSWAPNGREIYFTKNGNLHVVNVENGAQKQLIKDAGKYSFPAPSPDGNRLLIFLSEGSETKPCIFDINKLKIIKVFSGFRIITGASNFPIYYYIKWSIKGDKILFSYFEKKGCTNSKIAILNILNGDIINLTDGKSEDRDAVWYNKEEQVVFIRNKKEIWMINKDGSGIKKIFSK